MRKQILCLVCVLAFLGTAAAASAGELSVKIANGRATVIAKDVPIRQVLAEWAKVGETKVVNAERMPGGPVTLELIDVPEKEALDILLRTAAGYIAAPRPANLAGASQYDRVIILATSRPPAATATMAPPAFGRPAVQPVIQPPPDDDDGEPRDQGPMPAPVMGPNGPIQQTFPGPTVGPNGQVLGTSVPMNVPVGPNGVPIGPNGAPVGPNGVPIGPNGMPVNTQAPTTSPRPGMLPQPPQQQQQFPPNPYAPATRPGQQPQTKPGGQTDKDK
jgi:hypothetical protein